MPCGIRPSNVRVCHFTTRASGRDRAAPNLVRNAGKQGRPQVIAFLLCAGEPLRYILEMKMRASFPALLLVAVIARPVTLRGDCSLTATNVMPFSDAGPRFYKNSQGGLYPRGGNTRPPAHHAAAMAMAAQIQPLSGNGVPDPAAGKIVMISIGMSNLSLIHI